MPLVSVVIPTYNRSSSLLRSVRSALAQTMTDIEVIVVDDGSTDGSLEALRTSVSDERLVIVSHDSNRGGSAARNTGIDRARGRWIGFLDSDDYWLPERLERQVPLLAANEDCGVGYCGILILSNRHLRHARHPWRPSGEVFRELAAGHAPTGTPLLLVRRDLLASHRFDVKLSAYQDYDMVLGLATATRFHALPDPLVVMEAHGGPRLTSDYPRRAESLAYLRMKWLPQARTRGCGDEFLGTCRSLEWGLEAGRAMQCARETPFTRRAKLALGAFCLPERPFGWQRICTKLLLGERAAMLKPVMTHVRRLART